MGHGEKKRVGHGGAKGFLVPDVPVRSSFKRPPAAPGGSSTTRRRTSQLPGACLGTRQRPLACSPSGSPPVRGRRAEVFFFCSSCGRLGFGAFYLVITLLRRFLSLLTVEKFGLPTCKMTCSSLQTEKCKQASRSDASLLSKS